MESSAAGGGVEGASGDGEREVEGGNAIINFSDITDFDTLQLLISDLSRRLTNANNTIDAQKRVSKNSIAVADRCRAHLAETSTHLRLELSKSEGYLRKKMKEDETNNFENDKKRKRALEEKLRMAQLDYEMTASKPLAKRIDAMRTQLVELESKQDSQRRYISHLVEMEKMTEDLSSAAQLGDLKTCTVLLRRGAGLNDVDSAGYLPLHYASASGADQVVRLLCEYGQDPSSYVSGHSAVELAARHGHSHVIQVLLNFGASVEDAGSRGCPPLLSAVAGGHLDCVNDLLTWGADIHAIDTNEDTVLHAVSNASHPQDPVAVARLLLRKGADPTKRNERGLLPIDLAMPTRNQDLCRLLAIP